MKNYNKNLLLFFAGLVLAFLLLALVGSCGTPIRTADAHSETPRYNVRDEFEFSKDISSYKIIREGGIYGESWTLYEMDWEEIDGRIESTHCFYNCVNGRLKTSGGIMLPNHMGTSGNSSTLEDQRFNSLNTWKPEEKELENKMQIENIELKKDNADMRKELLEIKALIDNLLR